MFSQEGWSEEGPKISNGHCQAGFDPGGLQTDVNDMPSSNGYTSRCTRVLGRDSRPSVETSTAVEKGALLTFYTASRGAKRKKLKPSTAEKNKPNDWTQTYIAI